MKRACFLIVFSLLIARSAEGQYRPVDNWPTFALSFSSGFFNGVGDVLQFKYVSSRFCCNNLNQQYWNPKISWKNKYWHGSPANGAKFPGSTGPLVFLTDAWHLSKTLSLTSIQIGVLTHERKKPRKLWHDIADLLILKLSFSAGWWAANKILIR